MVATVILGLFVAIGFGIGMKTIYNNFFKGEAKCCSAECGGRCTHCHSSSDAHHPT